DKRGLPDAYQNALGSLTYYTFTPPRKTASRQSTLTTVSIQPPYTPVINQDAITLTYDGMDRQSLLHFWRNDQKEEITRTFYHAFSDTIAQDDERGIPRLPEAVFPRDPLASEEPDPDNLYYRRERDPTIVSNANQGITTVTLRNLAGDVT